MATIAELIVSYLGDVAKRSSVATVTHYRKRLTPFVRVLGNTLLPELSEAQVVTLIDNESRFAVGARAGQSKAPDTIRATITAWEQFQRWLLESKQIGQPIATGIKKPGGRKRDLLPTKEETKKILETADDDFRAIYRALRLTGARPNELCNATIGDIDRTALEIVLTKHKTAAKTGKPRRIAVGHPALVEILAQAIGDRVNGHVFLRSSGKPWTSETLSAEYRSIRDKLGLRAGLVLYLTRHEHGSELYRKTKDIKAVSDALGHSSIGTTMRYTRVDGDQLKQNQQLFEE